MYQMWLLIYFFKLAFAGCQRQLLRVGGPTLQTTPRSLPVRAFAAVKSVHKLWFFTWFNNKIQKVGLKCKWFFFLIVRAQKKDKTQVTEEPKTQKKVINDENRHKPYGKTAWAPVDDVYILRYYPRTIYGAAEATDMLKNFQKLDFTPHEQPVYIDLQLNMKLEKKVFKFPSNSNSAYIFLMFVFTLHSKTCFEHLVQEPESWNRQKILINLLSPAQSVWPLFHRL